MRALLLDLDNTLVDRDAALRAWLVSVLPSRSCTQEALDALIECDRGGYGSKSAFFKLVGERCGTSAEQARRRFVHELPRFIRLKADADELLRRFAGPTVIVTNGSSPMQRRKLAHAGLEGRVTHVLVSEECGLRKPDPAIFHKALALASCTPGEALMIGDHPQADIAGAQSADVSAVLLRTRWFDAPVGVRSVQSLAEVTW